MDDNHLLEELIEDSDIVIHLAAVKKVSESQNAFNTLNVNVEATRIILNFCNKFKKDLFLHLLQMFMEFLKISLLKKKETLYLVLPQQRDGLTLSQSFTVSIYVYRILRILIRK